MGKFYRNGRLYSTDTFRASGIRALAAATESDLWTGTAATRPVPAGIGLQLVSSSIQDDAVKAQKQGITFGGTMDVPVPRIVDATVTGTIQPIASETHVGTVGAAPGKYDLIRLNLDGTVYGYIGTGAATKVMMAAGVKDAATLGSFDVWHFDFAGGPAAGAEVQTLTIDGVAYPYNAINNDNGGAVTNGLVAAAAADTKCAVTRDSTKLIVTSLTRGPGVVVTCVADGVAFTVTASHQVVGVAANTDWTVTENGVDTVTAVHNTPGATAATCVGSAVPALGTTTFTCPQTVAGAAADVGGILLDAVDYTHTVVAGNVLDDVAEQLRIKIVAGGWTCTRLGAVLSITGVPGVAFTAANSSVNNQAGGVALAVTPVETQAVALPDILAVSDGTTTFSRTVSTAVLADEVAAVAAAINADAKYIATSNLGVISVTGMDGGPAFAFVNASTDRQNADLTCVIVDTQAAGAGTGVQSLRLDYLDGDGVRRAEVILPQGVNAVLTAATDVTGVLGLSALTVGSNGSAVGTIKLEPVGGGGTEYEVIPAGGVSASAAAYKVPARSQAFVTSMQASAGAVATTLRVKSDANPVTGAVVPGASFTWQTAIVGTDPATVSPAVPWGPFPAGSRVWVTGLSAGGTACQGTLEGYLEPVVGV